MSYSGNWLIRGGVAMANRSLWASERPLIQENG